MDGGRKIYIKNIASSVNAERLKKMFNEIDHVGYVMFKDYNTAIVKFFKRDAVRRAIAAFDGYWLHGKRIEIKKYDEKIHFDLQFLLASQRNFPFKNRSKPSKKGIKKMLKRGEVWKPKQWPSLQYISKVVDREWHGENIIGRYSIKPK
uniref:RRM domain-containing protein n=1 Tax=Panagrolaimus sp. PS1159 TaxID=55785 RepID=A0AC35GRQ8_9BILA